MASSFAFAAVGNRKYKPNFSQKEAKMCSGILYPFLFVVAVVFATCSGIFMGYVARVAQEASQNEKSDEQAKG
jgi:hypothetical protein